MKMIPTVLTIAGSDSGGGAGIQADLLSFAANKVFGTTAITAITAQNPLGVSEVYPVPASVVREQVRQVFDFFKPRVVKTGMLFNAEIIRVVAEMLEACPGGFLVLDPVMIATSGAHLLEPDSIRVLRERLIPRASLVTPNLDEAEEFLGEKFSWKSLGSVAAEEIEASARRLSKCLGVPVLLKGGHGSGDILTDVLAFPDARESSLFSSSRIYGVNTHGSGCTLAAAIAAQLALQLPESFEGIDVTSILRESVKNARAYLSRGLNSALPISSEKFIAHLV